jgi:ABC-type dipeptide/oligopeptide/nickel transport system permease subunit
VTLKQSLAERIFAIAPNKSNWGGMLFFATLVVVLIFFWWLLIYSGGVSGNHG